MLRLAINALSAGIRRQARRLGVCYEFLFTRASGDQLRQITALIDNRALRPVVGKVAPFSQTRPSPAGAGQGRHPRQGRHQQFPTHAHHQQ